MQSVDCYYQRRMIFGNLWYLANRCTSYKKYNDLPGQICPPKFSIKHHLFFTLHSYLYSYTILTSISYTYLTYKPVYVPCLGVWCPYVTNQSRVCGCGRLRDIQQMFAEHPIRSWRCMHISGGDGVWLQSRNQPLWSPNLHRLWYIVSYLYHVAGWLMTARKKATCAWNLLAVTWEKLRRSRAKASKS